MINQNTENFNDSSQEKLLRKSIFMNETFPGSGSFRWKTSKNSLDDLQSECLHPGIHICWLVPKLSMLADEVSCSKKTVSEQCVYYCTLTISWVK